MNIIKRVYRNWRYKRIFKKHFGEIANGCESATGKFIEIDPKKILEIHNKWEVESIKYVNRIKQSIYGK